MKLHPFKFAIACAISASLLWLLCSILVMAMPATMLSMSGHMMHMELNEMGWHMSLWTVTAGLIGWFVAAGALGWLLAAIYNRLL